MKNFFANKLNIALSILLVAVLGLAGYFVVNMTGFSFSSKVEAIDFTGYSKTQVEEWISENKIKEDIYSYSYEYSDTIEKDYVVYQSVKAGEKISDALVIVYSNGKDPSGEEELPSVSNGTTEESIESWLNLNEFSNVNYVYQTDETHDFGTVISISPSKAKKTDTVTVTVSLGDDIENITTEVPNFSTYTKAEIERWGARYAITLKIDYETHDQAKEDEFISQSVAAGKEIKGGDSLIVTLSSGQSSGKEATIPSDSLLGSSESDFLAKLKELGFTNISKSNTTYYAESLSKDTIYSYDDGTFPVTKTINYALCAGKYTFNADEFNGLTKTKAQNLADSYKNRNARINKTLISIAFVSGDTNADKANEVYDCAIDGAKISCKVYSNGETANIPTDARYLGVSESDYLTAIKALGYTNFKKSDTTYFSTKLAKGTIYSYDDGEIALAKTINYALSEGAYSFNASDFNGISQSDAQSKADAYKARNARLNGSLISIKFTSGDSSGTKGNTYDCAVSGSTISCKVYGGSSSSNSGTSSTKATIPASGLLGKSESYFVDYVKKLGFTNIKNSGTTYYSTTLGSGTIFEYPDGTFSVDKEISYSLSVGAYKFNASNYNGLSQSDAQNKVKDEASRNANSGKLTISFTNGEANANNSGKTYDCEYGGANISCKVYTSGSTTNKVNVTNFTGQSISSLQTWASNNGLNVSYTEEYNSSVASGNIISQSPSSGSVDPNSTITAIVSKGSQPVDNVALPDVADLQSMYFSSTFDETKTNISSYFSRLGFSKVNVTGEKTDKSAGYITSIKINGAVLTQGTYSTDATVDIVISTGYSN